jgi:hypothetical protein
VFVDTVELERRDIPNEQKKPVLIVWEDGTREKYRQVNIGFVKVKYYPEGIAVGDDHIRVCVETEEEELVYVPYP